MGNPWPERWMSSLFLNSYFSPIVELGRFSELGTEEQVDQISVEFLGTQNIQTLN